jgi:hypothetical protein
MRNVVNNFNKITPINGFDTDKNNAMQNNYAWSMSELGEFLYVGTGRNILYNVLLIVKNSGLIPGFQIPEDIIPDFVDERAEIWRYDKGSSNAGWQRVFKAPEGVTGFRYMIRYTDPSGVTALYAGTFSSPKARVYRSTNGTDWLEVDNDTILGASTRSMIIHTNGKLYMATVDEFSPDINSYIFEYVPPTVSAPQGSWKRVTADPSTPGFDPTKNPRGQVAIIESFNGHIYAGVINQSGFELWRTTGTDPVVNGWKLVIDKGAGDAFNKIPLTLGVFNDHLYVGSIMFPLLAANPLGPSSFKPFDLIRINKDDVWELVVGGQPVQPTAPTTGTRGIALSLLPSGVANVFNLYCWQLIEYEGELYLGTFDWLIVLSRLLKIPPSSPYSGFDLFKSKDGINWESITINGLGNPDNYGARLLFESTNGHLYLGTANPFDSCEVWENIL